MPGERTRVEAKCLGNAGECRGMQGNEGECRGIEGNDRGTYGIGCKVPGECTEMQGNVRQTYGSVKCQENAGE